MEVSRALRSGFRSSRRPYSAVTEAVGGIIEVAAENVAFVGNRLRIPLGEAVTIRVTNRDGLPHNLRIAGPDGEFRTEDDAVTEPEAIGRGETGELTFAPPLAGECTFRCDFHPLTMGGVIVVE
jgi:plastocyanin